jgi:hypothetical protein
MVEAFGWLAFLVGFGGALALMADRGYRDGMKLAWFIVTLAVPGWFVVTFRSVSVDGITGVALAILLATLYQPLTGFRPRWAIADVCLGLVFLATVVSDAANRMLIPGFLVEQVRVWVLPYFVGRVFLSSWDEMGRTLPILMGLVAGLSVFGIVEALIRTNVLAAATGKSWELLEKAEGFRWGLKRAQGIANHPIYFGLLLALTLPWVLTAYRQPGSPRWWAYVPALLAAAAFVTVSRSAHLAVAVVFAADFFFRKPQFRGVLLATGLAAGLTFFVFRQEALDLLGSYAGEASPETEMVKINGTPVPYSGTRHRDLLMDVYADAIDGAGWVGYGTLVSDMPKDAYMDPRFASIDHEYLLHFLKYGYLGLATLFLFSAAGTYHLARAALRRDGPLSDLAGGLCGAFTIVAVLIRGVAFSNDFRAMWLFAAGLGASLALRPPGSGDVRAIKQT